MKSSDVQLNSNWQVESDSRSCRTMQRTWPCRLLLASICVDNGTSGAKQLQTPDSQPWIEKKVSIFGVFAS